MSINYQVQLAYDGYENRIPEVVKTKDGVIVGIECRCFSEEKAQEIAAALNTTFTIGEAKDV